MMLKPWDYLSFITRGSLATVIAFCLMFYGCSTHSSSLKPLEPGQSYNRTYVEKGKTIKVFDLQGDWLWHGVRGDYRLKIKQEKNHIRGYLTEVPATGPCGEGHLWIEGYIVGQRVEGTRVHCNKDPYTLQMTISQTGESFEIEHGTDHITYWASVTRLTAPPSRP